MSMFTKKYSETEMLIMLNRLLIEPDEYIEAPIYCMFKGTGFLGLGDFTTGYAAITSKNRFIGYQIGVLNEAPILISMDRLIKIKISGSLFGQKSVYLEFKADKTYKIKGPADKKLDTKICCIQAILPAKIAIVYCNFSIFSYSKPCLREMECRWKHGIQ